MSGGRWPGLAFEPSEQVVRVERCRRAMRHAGVDALVVSDERLTWYLTGFGAATPIGSLARPRILVIGADGSIRFLVHESTERCVREMVSGALEVTGYPSLGHPGDALDAALAEVAPGVVGLELSAGLAPRLPADELLALRSGYETADATPMLQALRRVKSPDEIARIRRACEVTAAAYEVGFAAVSEGSTERAIAAGMLRALGDCGADAAWATCVIGDYDRVDGVPRDRPVRRGELVFVDMGANCGGYWADFSRAGVLGGASAHQEQAQAAIVDVTRAGVGALVAGATAGAVGARLDAEMASRGLVFATRPGRHGHGLGMEITESPDVVAHDPTVLAPGMVLTVEPATFDRHGIYHAEEDVLVTADGPEILSDCPRELRSLG